MMTSLSKLVRLRNTLVNKISLVDFQQSIDKICYNLSLIKNENYEINDLNTYQKIEQAIKEYKQLNFVSENILKDLKLSVEHLNHHIDSISLDINKNIFPKLIYENHPTKSFELDQYVNETVKIHMMKYADWHYPALRLGCRYVGQTHHNEQDNQIIFDYASSIDYSNMLVVNDPLYFCDFTEELIKNVTSHFNDVYSRRIRKYIINDHDLSKLPQNQFGFVFCWMFFNYLDLTNSGLYLDSIFKLLRAGGCVMLSYNNTDIPDSATYSEHLHMSSIAKRQLIQLAASTGFEIIETVDLPNSDSLLKDISWIELRKPGVLTSIKLKQVLGIIKP